MANDSLAEVMKKISKKYGDNVVRVGAQDLTVDGVLSLGSPSLDFCIYGGVPEGRIVEFSGPEGSGKTTNAFLAAASSSAFLASAARSLISVKIELKASGLQTFAAS